jgi:hypothetical protein
MRVLSDTGEAKAGDFHGVPLGAWMVSVSKEGNSFHGVVTKAKSTWFSSVKSDQMFLEVPD